MTVQEFGHTNIQVTIDQGKQRQVNVNNTAKMALIPSRCLKRIKSISI